MGRRRQGSSGVGCTLALAKYPGLAGRLAQYIGRKSRPPANPSHGDLIEGNGGAKFEARCGRQLEGPP